MRQTILCLLKTILIKSVIFNVELALPEVGLVLPEVMIGAGFD